MEREPEAEAERGLPAERRIPDEVWCGRIEESLRHGLDAAVYER